MQPTFSVFILCLLGAVILCGAQNLTTPIPTNATDVTNTTVAPTNSTEAATNTTVTTTIVTSMTPSSKTTVDATPSPESGLSSGAIAGITIGSIAGVAAVGGGVFGLLKYTGKI